MEPEARTFGGRYELTALLATGGMGQVWEARDLLLNRDVAVKVLRSEYTGDPAFLARFRAEAQLSAGLVHPNVATLFNYGEVRPDSPGAEHLAYLIMELVRGESLSALLARAGRLSPDRTLDILGQSATGLAAAHAAGVVHRDIKPGNVLLSTDGRVKITDFGVALSAATVPLTQTGQVIGTPYYLSPEQAAGHRATAASDVYALGVVAYECLAGHRPFGGETPVAIALAHLHDTAAPLSDDVPEPVRRLVERAMAKDPAERFPDGTAFRAAVDDVLTGRPPRGAGLAATAVLPAVGAVPAGATAPLPAAEPATGGTRPVAQPSAPHHPGEPADGRPRRRLVAALSAAAALAVAGVVAGTVALFGGAAPAAAPAPTVATTSAPAATTTASSTTAPTPTATSPALVDVTAADYVGDPYADVQAALVARGLRVALAPVPTAGAPAGKVTALDRVGPLPPGTVVTASYAVAPPAPSTVAPAPAPTPTTAGTGSGSGSGKDDGNGSDKGNDKEKGKGKDKGHG